MARTLGRHADEPAPRQLLHGVHADILSDLADRGRPMGAHDLWIAATALAHGFGVATRNRSRFDRVAGLRVLAARP